VTFVDTVTPGRCPQEKLITRTFTATDVCGYALSLLLSLSLLAHFLCHHDSYLSVLAFVC